MVAIKSIDINRLKKDLIKLIEPYGIWEYIMAIDTAREDDLIELANKYGLDMSDYINEYEKDWI